MLSFQADAWMFKDQNNLNYSGETQEFTENILSLTDVFQLVSLLVDAQRDEIK